MAGLDYRTEKNRKTQKRIRDLELELPSFVTDFIRSIVTSTGILTRLVYCYDYRLFFRYLAAEHPDFSGSLPSSFTAQQMDRLTVLDMERFVEFLTNYVKLPDSPDEDPYEDPVFVSNQNMSIARKLSSLRALFKYLESHNMIRENVLLKVNMPKIERKEIVFLERSEIERFFSVVNTGEGLSKRQQVYNMNFRARDIAIVGLLLGTGIRESELIALDIDDIDMETQSFLVYRKGGKEQIIYFNDQVRDLLLDYLIQRERIEAAKGHEAALFLSSQKKRISARALQDLVKKYAAVAAPLKKKLSPHKLRASFATGLYRESRDIYMVSESLGHSRIETVTRYAQKVLDERRQAAMTVNWVPGSDDSSDPE